MADSNSTIKRTKVRSLSSFGKFHLDILPTNKHYQDEDKTPIYNFSLTSKETGEIVTGILSKGAAKLIDSEGSKAKEKIQVSETSFTTTNGETREANYMELIPLASKTPVKSFDW